MNRALVAGHPARDEQPAGPPLHLHRHVGATAHCSGVQHLCPRRSAIERPVHTDPCRRPDALRIARTDDDLHRVMEVGIVRVRQLRPVHAGVGRLEDAGTADGVDITEAFTGARVDDVRIRRFKGERDDREVGHLVGVRGPVCAGVGRLPDTASNPTRVHDVGIARVDQDRARTTALIRRTNIGPAAKFGRRWRSKWLIKAPAKLFDAWQKTTARAVVTWHAADVAHRWEIHFGTERARAARRIRTARDDRAGATVHIELFGEVGIAKAPLRQLVDLVFDLGAVRRRQRGCRTPARFRRRRDVSSDPGLGHRDCRGCIHGGSLGRTKCRRAAQGQHQKNLFHG